MDHQEMVGTAEEMMMRQERGATMMEAAMVTKKILVSSEGISWAGYLLVGFFEYYSSIPFSTRGKRLFDVLLQPQNVPRRTFSLTDIIFGRTRHSVMPQHSIHWHLGNPTLPF